MEVEEILYIIFGESLGLKSSSTTSQEKSIECKRISHDLNLVNNYIEDLLAKHILSGNIEDIRDGCIGPRLVKFDISTRHGLFIVSPDKLSINSQSTFSTMRANTAVYKGKWMYELQLGSKGLMQIGWATAKCKFNQESGVGDTITSFAYDGNRVRKWNVATYKYGEPWLTGDIIGCALDMDNGIIDFYRNGRSLGRAFENIPIGAGIAYFPAVSLAFTENLTANFGSTPMRYPIEGYQPLETPPKVHIAQAKVLFKWLLKIIKLLHVQSNEGKENFSLYDGSISVQAFLICLARSVLKRIGPLVTIPYIIEYSLVPCMQHLSEIKEELTEKQTPSDTCNSKFITCLDLLWTFLEEYEIKSCLESVILYLLSTFRHVSLLLEYPSQCKSLTLLMKICEHPVTRQHLLQFLLFDRVRFANFVHVKPLDEGGLANVVKNVWWETNSVDGTMDINREVYLNACENIKTAISEVETLQVKLLVTLLDNSDGTARRSASRTVFLKKFKRFVQDNLASSRTPLPITLCCFHRLLAAFQILWDSEVGTSPIYIPCRAFYDASITYSGIDRLGGVLSHLNKTFKSELLRLLGPDHDVITAIEQSQDIPSTFSGTTRLAELPVFIPMFARMINVNSPSQGNSMVLERLGYFPYAREETTPMHSERVDPVISLLELLDGVILFFHVAAKKQLAKVASLRESMSEYITAISEAKTRLDLIKKNRNSESQIIQSELLRTIHVFNTKLTEQARHMAWIQAAVYSEEKQKQLAWLLRIVTLTLKNASKEGNMFSFVPGFYLESLADLCIALRNHVHPTARIEDISGYQQMLVDAAEFLCEHFSDPRIVHASSKDTLILTLAGFVSNPLTLEALENVPRQSRLKMVKNLLKPYENRAWAQSNWVLVRFWQGNGFGFRYEKSPHLSMKIGPKVLQHESISQPIRPCPSAIYQGHIKEVLLQDPENTTKFLNSLLNQLNWAFSEFIGMVQEIHNVSTRPERVFIESRQLKICATCFDLAISLLRVLEMISTLAPNIFCDFTKATSENLLSRLCQLLCQVLNRMSSQTSCFQHVVLLEIPDLESVDHFPILAAVVGILLAVLKEDMSTFTSKPLMEVPKVTRALLVDPGFQITSLHFVLGNANLKTTKVKNVKAFSFLNYQEDVTEAEIKSIKSMLQYLETCHKILPDSKSLSDDDSTCTICYAFPIGAIFKPCNHQTCRTCIDRHLLNSRDCFFCKATIEKVIDLSENILHDFSHEFQLLKPTETS